MMVNGNEVEMKFGLFYELETDPATYTEYDIWHNALKQIDMQHRRPRGRPRSAAKGIYTLEGDTLKICWVYQGKRPTSFKAPQPGRGRLLVLKRVK